MTSNQTALLLASHDVAARVVLDRIQCIVASERCHRNDRTLRAARAELVQHFADYQLIADAARLNTSGRHWMRRAVIEADLAALPRLLPALRDALGDPASAAS